MGQLDGPFKSSNMLGDFQKAPQQAHGDPAPLSAKGLIRGRRLVSYQFIEPLV